MACVCSYAQYAMRVAVFESHGRRDAIAAVICFPKTSFLFRQAAVASVIGLALATHRYRTGESLPRRARRTIFTGGNPCCRKASWKLCRFSSPPFIFR